MHALDIERLRRQKADKRVAKRRASLPPPMLSTPASSGGGGASSSSSSECLNLASWTTAMETLFEY